MGNHAEFRPGAAESAPLRPECVRRAAPEDVDAIARITEAHHATRDQPSLPGTEGVLARLRGELDGLTRDEPWMVFVAESGPALVGYARVRLLGHAADGLPDPCPPGWYLTGVVVAPGWRRRGIGRNLTRARIDWVRERADAVHCVVNHANLASIALHKQFDFEAQAVEFAYPRAGLARGEGALYSLAL